jgi:predicted Zn-dependent peptidase
MEVAMPKRVLLFVLCLLALPGPVAAQRGVVELPIREHIFPNGLRLLVLERPGDHRVAAKIFTRMGALNEVPGELGAAHFLEHLMFKGTPTLGTTDWTAERPLRERIDALEAELVAELNRARNDVRQRGVFHEYAHRDGTPAADSLRARIARLERLAQPYREHGATMRWYQRYGGANLTASTEQEYMKFDINVPVEHIEVFFRVEADRMQNTVFREFDEERMILVEQRYGDLNRPATPYYEAMNSLVGRIHPVFWPEGYLTDFDQYTRAYQRRLYEAFFVPNNTTIVLVGGVQLEAMVPLVERYFGALPRAPEPPREQAIEPVPDAERRLIWRSSALAPRVEARFLIPAIGHPDRPHFDVLGEVVQLMLARALADAGIAGRPNVNTTVVHTRRFGVPASQNFEIVVTDEAALDAAERVLLGTLERLKAGDVAAADLALARKRLCTEWHRTVRQPDVLAFDIGHFETMDAWRTLGEFVAARERTAADDIARIAQRHFIPENRTIGLVRRPEPTTATNHGDAGADR